MCMCPLSLSQSLFASEIQSTIKPLARTNCRHTKHPAFSLICEYFLVASENYSSCIEEASLLRSDEDESQCKDRSLCVQPHQHQLLQQAGLPEHLKLLAMEFRITFFLEIYEQSFWEMHRSIKYKSLSAEVIIISVISIPFNSNPSHSESFYPMSITPSFSVAPEKSFSSSTLFSRH